MNKRLAIPIFLAALVLLTIAGTKVSRLTQTPTIDGSSLFIVVTGATDKATRSITATNLFQQLTNLYPVGSGGGSATNAISTVKTNGVNVSTAAISLDIITGSNTLVKATNTAGAVTVQINATASAAVSGLMTNANQFGESTNLTIKKSAVFTNALFYGTLTHTNPENGGSLGYVSFYDGAVVGDYGGEFEVGNYNGPILEFVTSTKSISPSLAPRASLGTTTTPFDQVHATNVNSKKTINLAGITGDRALVANSSKDVTNSAVTGTELGYLSGVSSAIQTQFGSVSNYVDLAASNRVRLVGGSGGITVSQSGSGGVQTWTVNDDDAGGGSTTNFNTLGVGSMTLGGLRVTNDTGIRPYGTVVWDDFEGAGTTAASLGSRRPHGGVGNWIVTGGAHTNVIQMTNGELRYPTNYAVAEGQIYLSYTNHSLAQHHYNQAWMKIRMTNDTSNPANGLWVEPGIVFEPDAVIEGQDIHIYATTGNLVAQVGGTNFIVETLPTNPYGTELVFGVTIISNTAFVQWGKDLYIGTHPALNSELMANNVVTFELNGMGTNQIQTAITEVGLGFADPSLYALAGRAITIGTNGTIAGLKIEATATNLINTLTEDQVGATNDFILVHDISAAGLKKMALGNVPVDWSNLTGVPAGFADGTDDGAGAGEPLTVGQLDVRTNASISTLRVTNWITSATFTNTSSMQQDGLSFFNDAVSVTAALSVKGANPTRLAGPVSVESLIVTNRVTLNIAKTGASIPITDGAGFSIVTNSNVTFSFSGTPIHGQQFTLSVSNSAATNLPVGIPSAFSPQLRANVTSWTVAASNYVRLPFIYTTNEVGGGIWILDRVTDLEASLAVASAGANGFLTLLTNAGGTIVTVSNSYLPQASSMALSNLVGTVAKNVTNVISLSTSNATSKPLTNAYSAGTLTLFGLEQGANITLTPNGSNIVVASTASGGGSSTNALPNTLAINSGTGSTNIIIDFWTLAQMSTNRIRVTLTANAGVIVTNIVDGKELTLDVIQDSTGNRTIAQSSVGGAPLRFGTDITGFALTTNGTYIDHVRLVGVGTNAHVVGMIRGYAP